MLKQIELKDVKITDGYFKEKQDMNVNVTVPATYGQFSNTGRFDALKLKWRKGEPNQPHIFWDSDVAKWLEGAAYTLIHRRDENLEKLIDAAVDDIGAGQTSDGYFNSHYQVAELANRFTNRNNHELYCAGHLIEAAVAYKKATSKDKFLNIMCKYVEYIDKVFTDSERDKNFRTCGHQEIELALVRLYQETGNKRYLDLSKFFIDTRGTLEGEKQTFAGWASAAYGQDHLPIAEQTTAEGHSVRCLYMFAGAADIAREFGDDKLKKACESVFENIVNKRMYVTGGLGGNFSGEAFSYDYDLPNELAYTETCASIAMMFFCQRMYLLTGEKKYMDIVELQLYNAVLSGVSLYGDRFFYCNPLEVHPDRRDYFTSIRNSQFAPDYQRPEYFGCSCCPPNVVRLIASLGQYMYHTDNTDGEKIYINLYNSSEFNHNGVKVIQETDYPRSGEVKITVETDKAVNILLRVPDWYKDKEFKFKLINPINGELNPAADCNGYLNMTFKEGNYEFILHLDMPVVELYANPKVHQNAGKVAVKRGPIVYCLESVDNGENLTSAKMLGGYKCENGEIFGNPIVKITCDGEISTEESSKLYSEAPFKSEKKKLTLIPYATWANRGRSEMVVWIRK